MLRSPHDVGRGQRTEGKQLVNEPLMDARPDPDDDQAEDEGYVSRPRWVKWFMAVALLLAGVYLVLLVASGTA